MAVTFDGIAVGRGAFLPTNDYTFAVSYRTAADGRPHVVRATAAAPFGPSGEYGDAGAFREAIVTLPTACTTDSPTTTAAPSGSPTTTSSVVGSTTTSMSVVPVLVGGIVETRPESQAAVPIAALPRFAG